MYCLTESFAIKKEHLKLPRYVDRTKQDFKAASVVNVVNLKHAALFKIVVLQLFYSHNTHKKKKNTLQTVTVNKTLNVLFTFCCDLLLFLIIIIVTVFTHASGMHVLKIPTQIKPIHKTATLLQQKICKIQHKQNNNHHNNIQ